MAARLLVAGSSSVPTQVSRNADAPQPGVWMLALEDRTGELRLRDSAPVAGPVSWLAGRGRTFVAAVQTSPGAVAGYRVTDAGCLRPEWETASGGDSPCHLDVHPDGARIVVAHYADGRVTVLRPPSNGRPAGVTATLRRRGGGPDSERQERSHPHMASYLTTDQIIVVDLGTDELVTYPCDRHGDLLCARPTRTLRRPAGSGPRHLATTFSSCVVVLDELSSTVGVVDLATDDPVGGAPSPYAGVAASGHRESRVRNYPSVVAVSASGRLAYVANRGADTISTFDLTGRMPRQVGECSAGGRWPQALLVTPRFLVVAAQDDNVITVLPLGAVDGLPGPAREGLSLPSPSCLLEMDIAGVS